MNREGYFKIMKAAVNLIVVIMVEAGRVPVENAAKIGRSILRALTGETGEKT